MQADLGIQVDGALEVAAARCTSSCAGRRRRSGCARRVLVVAFERRSSSTRALPQSSLDEVARLALVDRDLAHVPAPPHCVRTSGSVRPCGRRTRRGGRCRRRNGTAPRASHARAYQPIAALTRFQLPVRARARRPQRRQLEATIPSAGSCEHGAGQDQTPACLAWLDRD